MPVDSNDPNLPKEVHVEREKTKRTLIVALAITIVGVLATVLFFQNVTNRGGTLKVTDKGVEVTLEQPITAQLGTPSENVKAFGDSVTFTTGTISDSALRSIPGVKTDGAFSGQNLVDTTAGFVLASDRPSAWTLERTKEGLQRLSANDGSQITVRAEPATRANDPDRLVHRLLDSLQRTGTKADSRIDSAAKTVMIWYRDPQTQETVCVKFVEANGMIYTAKATTKDPSSVTSLVKSVFGFTVIAKPTALKPTVRNPRLIVPSTRRLPR
ncbi:MAG: hypothetical protein IPH85_01085 [Ignavibacteria bacterium]|nr:hypothetical protein [Ignavibacteria bacterium]MBK6419742.1 hypothetical protein [Ignavibacteria bacterium]MBK6759627.1 hypothetical protein [Ignavibacteria bacterium]MBK7184519.1 hypothetical protein [Ignavibacteria bacterium]MBK7413321.1 hypothetical protein [Ignavibacteria bacterium]